MSKNRKKYTAKFKSKAVCHALREDMPISELSSMYGVHSSVITRWKQPCSLSSIFYVNISRDYHEFCVNSVLYFNSIVKHNSELV